MGTIQSNIGIITGMPIGTTVDSLMALAAQPRDRLIERNDTLKQEQIAVTELSAMLLAVKYLSDNLGKDEVFDKKEVTSTNPDVLSATVTGDPALGTYQFTPVQTVQNQQWLTSGVKSDSDPLGGGQLSFRFGNHVETAADLSLLNGGDGITRGWIRITDRSGTRADIDLSTAQTIDDVLEAINENTTINVTATTDGDRIRLIDKTGQTQSNLRVEEIGSGTTAASLGLAGINVAGSVADGQDLIHLYDDLDLAVLNDGNGIRTSQVMPDIYYELADGTRGTIDLSPLIPGTSDVELETNLGEMLDQLNEAAPGKLRFEIAPDGERLMATDLTDGEAQFKLESFLGDETHALYDLGLDGEAVDGMITGRRLLSGAKTVLLSSLNGGNGYGQLGAIELTDRTGASDTVDLSDAETLQDVVQRINAADVGVVAKINAARNGIELTETTGAQAANFIVANADETATADALGIAVDTDARYFNTGDMHLKVVGRSTRLADLNGGAGVARGSLLIRDSNGQQAKLDLTKAGIDTIGDVIDEINRLTVDVRAEINPTGNGIRLVDTAGGAGELEVLEGSTTTARDLHLFRLAKDVEIDGETTQVIDGSIVETIEIDDEMSLDGLRQEINRRNAGIHATTFVDGSSRPYRLALVSDRSGEAGEMVIDMSQLDLTVAETVKAQDALLVFGNADSPANNILVSSSTNTFDSVLAGVRVTIKQPSDQPVALIVDNTDVDVVANVTAMVGNYNRFRERLGELTYYDVDTNTKSILTGDAAALRVDTELSALFSGQFNGAGSIRSMAEIGIDMNTDGTLTLDESRLKSAFAENREGLLEFFTTEEFGFAAKFERVAEQISGEDVSLLANRFKALRDKIDRNQDRIDFLNERLENEREQLLLEFYRMELAISKMQAGLSAIESLNPVAPMTSAPRGLGA